VNIGIIGQGFVGSAIREGLNKFYKVRTYDLDEEKCNSTHQEVCYKSSIIFVCVPTPMRLSGACDTRILETVVEKINRECSSDPNRNRPILVIKSTVPPGTTKKISKIASVLQVCFSPEFLTEANSFEDFKNQSRIIIGGDGAKKVKQMFRKPFPDIPIVITKSETAEMVKYFINCFLASKVTFANQRFQICLDNNVDYDKVCEYALYDERIGKSHLAVPGPDGDLGFGGHCFPKDLAAMIEYGTNHDGDTSFLKAVQQYNDKCRRIRDWELMKGRAVSED
jgi:UDPglucose 6-dehydrogenase